MRNKLKEYFSSYLFQNHSQHKAKELSSRRFRHVSKRMVKDGCEVLPLKAREVTSKESVWIKEYRIN